MKIRIPFAPSAGFGRRSKGAKTVEVKYLKRSSGSEAGDDDVEEDRRENVCFTPVLIVAIAPSVYSGVSFALPDTLSICVLNNLLISGVRYALSTIVCRRYFACPSRYQDRTRLISKPCVSVGGRLR